MTPDEARELETLAQQAGVVHGVSFVYRQFAMVQQAASMVRSGSVGRLFAVQGAICRTGCCWRLTTTGGSMPNRRQFTGDSGYRFHWCDTVQFVTGKRIVEVMADLAIV